MKDDENFVGFNNLIEFLKKSRVYKFRKIIYANLGKNSSRILAICV